jgi:hypothetical protein
MFVYVKLTKRFNFLFKLRDHHNHYDMKFVWGIPRFDTSNFELRNTSVISRQIYGVEIQRGTAQSFIGSTMTVITIVEKVLSTNPQLEDDTGDADMKIMEVTHSMHSRGE